VEVISQGFVIISLLLEGALETVPATAAPFMVPHVLSALLANAFSEILAVGVSHESTTVDSLTTLFELDRPDSETPPARCLEKYAKFCTTSALLTGGIGGLGADTAG
jgi:hypothetical protein